MLLNIIFLILGILDAVSILACRRGASARIQQGYIIAHYQDARVGRLAGRGGQFSKCPRATGNTCSKVLMRTRAKLTLPKGT